MEKKNQIRRKRVQLIVKIQCKKPTLRKNSTTIILILITENFLGNASYVTIS